MTIPAIITDTVPRWSNEPPEPPPPRHEMIEALQQHNQRLFGPVEDFANMSSAELWNRYRKWRDFIDSMIVF